jgi:hypothetical protein
MTRIAGISAKEVGNIYGDRTWVEYGFRQSKSELGWSDYRLTDYNDIEKWWELVMSAYLMVSLQAEVFQGQCQKENRSSNQQTAREIAETHPWWSVGKGWKDNLNNIRLFIEPFGYLNRLKAWLCVFFTPRIIHYFSFLYTQLDRLINYLLESVCPCHFCLPIPQSDERGITSWYRPPVVNRAVNGASHSQHLYGRGVDIRPVNPASLASLNYSRRK